MKKLLLIPIIILFISCQFVKSVNDYTIEQEFFGGQYKTWIWFNGKIVKSYSIETDSVSKQRILQDSIKAVNFIDCIKNGKNCVKKKPKQTYRIEQGFKFGYFNTWIWKNDDLIMSFETEQNKITNKTIIADSLKAVKWINRVKNLKLKY